MLYKQLDNISFSQLFFIQTYDLSLLDARHQRRRHSLLSNMETTYSHYIPFSGSIFFSFFLIQGVVNMDKFTESYLKYKRDLTKQRMKEAFENKKITPNKARLLAEAMSDAINKR